MSSSRKPPRSPITSCEAPDPGKRRHVKILSPKPGASVRAIIISTCIFWAECHYWNKNSYRCYGETCSFRHQGIHPRPRKKGYVAVLYGTEAKIGLLEITEGLYRNSLSLAKILADLQGWEVVLKRVGEVNNSTTALEPIRKHDSGKLPKEPNIGEQLAIIWDGGELFDAV